MNKFIFLLTFALILCFVGFAKNQENSQSSEIQPLKILEQPSVQQSEMKINGEIVEGSVQLRVEFLSSGKIGEVTLKKAKKKMQKNGQVAAAIDAAKKIQFEPTKKDGQPITVVKTLEYRFSRVD